MVGLLPLKAPQRCDADWTTSIPQRPHEILKMVQRMRLLFPLDLLASSIALLFSLKCYFSYRLPQSPNSMEQGRHLNFYLSQEGKQLQNRLTRLKN